MNYYSLHIGDYRRDTVHLSMTEHGAYRQLLDQYYLNEKPITLDEAKLMRSLCVRTAEEKQAVKNVLDDFFIRTAEGYMHKRCEIEIEAFHSKSKSASESAKARWERVRAEKDTNAMRTHTEGNANHKPITNNQEPLKSKDLSPPKTAATEKRATRLPADWILPKPWGEWALAEKPMLSADDIRHMAEMFKDHWIANASRATGKKDDWFATWRNWVRKHPNRANVPKPGGMSYHEKTTKTADQIFGRTPNGAPNGTGNQVIDITPRQAIEGCAENIPENGPGVRSVSS